MSRTTKLGDLQKPFGGAVNDFESMSISELIASLECNGVKVERFGAGSKAERMARFLAPQPKVRTIIGLEGKEKKGVAIEPVTLNGLRFNILKGYFINIPEDVAKLLEDSHQATRSALD